MAETVTLQCNKCDTEFEIKKSRVTWAKKHRNQKHFFCSRSCSSGFFVIEKNKKRTKGPFHRYLNRLEWNRKSKKEKNSYKYKGFNLNVKYLEKLWDEQDGKCAISGVQMQHRIYNTNNTPFTASVDRIDSTKAYVKGNVQFVCYSHNLGKKEFTMDEYQSFLEECHKIKQQ